MKLFTTASIALVLLACLVYSTSAGPVVTSNEGQHNDVVVAEDGSNTEADAYGRVKVITCDVLAWLGIGKVSCQAHCLLLKKRGGYCSRQKVCVCLN
ncbi:phormicin-like [Musca domestica]|uniref:Phormicin-like n=1 Tax=Musca domestica TaxID=7370 RepID=A0A1I8NIT8_MUSDO|nr:phormicin-like [Musca domestica]